MTPSAIREKLYDYIHIAEDKKIMAIFAILEDTIDDDVQWWKDAAVTDELEARILDFKSGKDKGYSMDDMEASIITLKQKRGSK